MKASAKTNLKQVKNGHEFLVKSSSWDALIIRNSRYNPVTDEDEFTNEYRVTYLYPKYDYSGGKREIILGEFDELVLIETLSVAVRYFNRYKIIAVTNLTTGDEHYA